MGGLSVVRLLLALASAVCVVGRHFATQATPPAELLPLEGSQSAIWSYFGFPGIILEKKNLKEGLL